MTDLSTTIAPKSDQLNADDLIAGPKTITVTKVRGCAEPEQPVAVHFEGDDGKPYKPCKSMRRVMVNTWGADGGAYVGRSMTLYRDDKVAFGGIAVGGIRISHMSHIDREITMALTASRTKRAPYTVKPLRQTRQPDRVEPPSDVAAVMAWAETLEDGLPFFTGVDELRADWEVHKAALKAADPDRFRTLNLAIAKRAQEIGEAAKGGEE